MLQTKIAKGFRFASATTALLAVSSSWALASKEPLEINLKTNPATAAVNWTSVLMAPNGLPRAFRGSDGKYNLVYEMQLTNFNVTAATIKSFAVLDQQNNQAVLDLKIEKLRDCFLPIPPVKKDTVVAAGGSAIIFVNIVFEEEKQVPKELLHRIQYQLAGAKSKSEETITGAPLAVVQKAPIKIASPLAGGKWIAAGGYCGKLGHRRAIFPIDNHLVAAQKYAIDWILADDKNITRAGDLTKVTASKCYGLPIYAALAGKVVGVYSSLPDQKFGVASGDKYHPGGNSITIEAEPGVFTFYAHLKPDSILVNEGELVKQGQQLASLGNSGNSDGPHLHFHVTEGPGPLSAEGIPYVFEEFDLVGNIADVDQMIKDDDKGKAINIGAASNGGKHHDELIKEGHVVIFPPKAKSK